ncbi:hypothetical protein [Paenibacillus sp. FSL E2-0177]|uniref:hypothetical protein n=1 Tax=unclassified Paenibacillus TaxID=185978 RepID=UPI0030EF0CA2
MDANTEYFKRLAQDQRMREKRDRGEEKRITVVLSEYDYNRLAYIAKLSSLKRSTIAKNMIINALLSAEEVFGLSEYVELEDSQGEPTGVLTKYGEYINGRVIGDEAYEDDGSRDKPAAKTSPRRPVTRKNLTIE